MEYPFDMKDYAKAKFISLGVENYYGSTEACEISGKYYIVLENWNGISYKEISKELFEAIVKEFNNN